MQVRNRSRRFGRTEVRAVRERRGGDARRRRRRRGRRGRIPVGVRAHRAGHAGVARAPQRIRRNERSSLKRALRRGVPRESRR